MLVSLAVYVSVSKIVTTYEKSINDDYSIIIVMNTPIIEDKVKSLPSLDIKEIKYLKREKILSDLKGDLTDGSFQLLQNKLPYFYTIYLNQFPTSSKLESIKKDLQTLSGIKKIETFSQDHDEVYSLLLLIKSIVTILFAAIILFTFFIITNQVKIWFFEHQERLDIIKLHGGSIFYGAKPIIKLALVSSIVSSSTVIALVFFIKENLSKFFSTEIVKVLNTYPIHYSNMEVITIFLLSLMIAFLTVFGVLIKHRLR
jgi:cell division transport system permease protein